MNKYEEVLNSYTTLFENSRYDRLSFDMNNSTIADIATSDHIVHNNGYRSYGTYRKDITCENMLVKLNETYFNSEDIITKFYSTLENQTRSNVEEEETENLSETEETEDTDAKPTKIPYKINYNFAGCVLSKQFATNGNNATLEDIFAEYGYEYMRAKDAYYKSIGGKGFFQALYNSSRKENIQNTYLILPIGTEFIEYTQDSSLLLLDANQINSSTNDEVSPDSSTPNNQSTAQAKNVIAEYDGTYVPTVQELLSGKLYIVIKSGSGIPFRVYFNNKYMPSLFINDDKFLALIDKYVLDDNQNVKLCDMSLYQRVGMKINWEQLFYIGNIKTFVKGLTNKGIDISNIWFRFYLYASYSITDRDNMNTSEDPKTVTFIQGLKMNEIADQIVTPKDDLIQKGVKDTVLLYELTVPYTLFAKSPSSGSIIGPPIIPGGGTSVAPVNPSGGQTGTPLEPVGPGGHLGVPSAESLLPSTGILTSRPSFPSGGLSALISINKGTDANIMPFPLPFNGVAGNPASTGPIHVGTMSNPYIKLELFLSVSLILNNYSFNSTDEPGFFEPIYNYKPCLLFEILEDMYGKS